MSVRFIGAIVSFVLAFAAIGLGIAQRTIFATPDHVAVIPADYSTTNTAILVDGELLNAHDGRQKITLNGDGELFAAYGRTGDLVAWLGDAQYVTLEYDSETGELIPSTHFGEESVLPAPHGSDLWLDEYSRLESLNFVIDVPDSVSLLIMMADGESPAPTDLSITWPVDNRTPWSGPLILGGVLILMVGMVLYLWALSQVRRTRGPRRKTPRPPRPPKRKTIKSSAPRKALTASAPDAKKHGRRSAGASRLAIPAGLLVATLALTGCSAESWPGFLGGTGDVNPSPRASEPMVEDEKPPTAVSASQLREIVSSVTMTVNRADEDRDLELAGTRLTGAALQLRAANYAIRGSDANYAKPAPFPTGQLEIVLPQQTDTWPRVVFAVINPEPTVIVASPEPGADEGSGAVDAPVETLKREQPVALVLIQESPRENYKVAYHMLLNASVSFPEVPAATTGTQRVSDTVTLLALSPVELVAQYGDILVNGEESEFYDTFDVENDQLIPLVGKEAQAERKKKLPAIAQMSFAMVESEWAPIGFATVDAGAIVAVQLNEVETVSPVEAGAIINAEGAVKSLSGVSSTNRGTIASYGDQLLFYVPSGISKQKIVLLGWTSSLIAAKERP